MAAYAAHTTNYSTRLLTAKTINKHKKSLPFEKRFRENGQENEPKAKQDKMESDRIRQKNERRYPGSFRILSIKFPAFPLTKIWFSRPCNPSI